MKIKQWHEEDQKTMKKKVERPQWGSLANFNEEGNK
jgi:hypothetical protein